ncbi:FAD/NAD(P)-binding domain-containing protein [Eremomyces bilateralis CBS 781.70]|uniref:FAD/NAD(P)-binding domain-containing protein n=1 Tax=Eremomyces bilateralis CBS 781.70 TaxID=1392243 RepID=A0A6G1GA92_9PEZI|nr:FAD/NAD(P)-binding domain-containing protein [Eremomyces bilateralis CBS 781.70]KAF1815007.1 FAD/NAD(P)-binding domain-containing protein [Eremomyces bilateralis CBS 781.70]
MSLGDVLRSLHADIHGQIEAVQRILAELGTGSRRTAYPTPEPESSNPSSRVLIVGAGVGGLALAQGLRRAGVQFHVFERDLQLATQHKSHRLRIDADGVSALKEILSPQLWTKFERTCAGTTILETDIDAIRGKLTGSRIGNRKGGATYTADRNVLKGILSTGVDQNMTYGKHFIDYNFTDKGVVVNFLDGTSEEGAILVGADGKASRVREQYLPSHIPIKTDGCCISGKTPWTNDITEQYPGRPTKGMTFVMDGRSASSDPGASAASFLVIEPIRFRRNKYQDEVPRDYLFWVLVCMKGSFGIPEDQFLTMPNEEAAQLCLQVTQDWNPKMRAVLEHQDVTQTFSMRLSTIASEIKPWPASERTTLVGDAVHFTSPISNGGANAALRDAAELSRKLSQEEFSVQAIGEFESQMRGRVKRQFQANSGIINRMSGRMRTAEASRS